MSEDFTEKCPKCGKPHYYIGDVHFGHWEDNICRCGIDKKLSTSPVSYGWQCPICGNVYAPWVAQCSGYHGNVVRSTDNTTTYTVTG